MSQELHDLRVVEEMLWRVWLGCGRTGRRRGYWWGRSQGGVLVDGGGGHACDLVLDFPPLIWAIGTTGVVLGKVQGEN